MLVRCHTADGGQGGGSDVTHCVLLLCEPGRPYRQYPTWPENNSEIVKILSPSEEVRRRSDLSQQNTWRELERIDQDCVVQRLRDLAVIRLRGDAARWSDVVLVAATSVSSRSAVMCSGIISTLCSIKRTLSHTRCSRGSGIYI